MSKPFDQKLAEICSEEARRVLDAKVDNEQRREMAKQFLGDQAIALGVSVALVCAAEPEKIAQLVEKVGGIIERIAHKKRKQPTRH